MSDDFHFMPSDLSVEAENTRSHEPTPVSRGAYGSLQVSEEEAPSEKTLRIHTRSYPSGPTPKTSQKSARTVSIT